MDITLFNNIVYLNEKDLEILAELKEVEGMMVTPHSTHHFIILTDSISSQLKCWLHKSMVVYNLCYSCCEFEYQGVSHAIYISVNGTRCYCVTDKACCSFYNDFESLLIANQFALHQIFFNTVKLVKEHPNLQIRVGEILLNPAIKYLIARTKLNELKIAEIYADIYKTTPKISNRKMREQNLFRQYFVGRNEGGLLLLIEAEYEKGNRDPVDIIYLSTPFFVSRLVYKYAEAVIKEINIFPAVKDNFYGKAVAELLSEPNVNRRHYLRRFIELIGDIKDLPITNRLEEL